MRSKDIIGKTVAKVGQDYWLSNTGRKWIIRHILFTDGTLLHLNVAEGEGDYGIVPLVWKPPEQK